MIHKLKNIFKKQQLPIKDNNAFCILPWIHLHAWPDGNAYLCCIANPNNIDATVGDLSKNSISEVLNNDKMKKIRLDMLNGKKVLNCENCYKVESFKGYSWRNGFNKQFRDHIESSIAETQEDGSIIPKLLYVDFRFSNLCNLECRTCTGELSSSIANNPNRSFSKDKTSEYQNKNVLQKGNIITYVNSKENFYEDLKKYLPDTKCFYFAGGEPLLQKEHYLVLKYIHSNQWFNKELRYSTNLSTLCYKDTNFLDLWKDFDNVWLMCSIDHFGDKLEYIRQNVSHDRVFSNFDKLVSTQHKLSITFVVSVYNIYYLYDFFKFLEEKKYVDRLHSLELLYVYGDIDSPALLPESAKIELLEKLKKDYKTSVFQKIFKKFPNIKHSFDGFDNFINTNSNLKFKDFINRVEKFDKSYDKNISKTIPWLGQKINEYKEKYKETFYND